MTLDIFIPFYTCREGRKIHVKALQRCVAGVLRNGYTATIIDGSLSQVRLTRKDVDLKILRNEKHALTFAINMAIEHADGDFLCLMPASLVGLRNIDKMIQEKRLAELQYGEPVCLTVPQIQYPTNDEWLLANRREAQKPQVVKKKLSEMGFNYTEEGEVIAKGGVEDEWRPCYYIGPNFLVNKDRLFEVGGSDERCMVHADYDLAFRWMSFGYPLLFANSACTHRLHATSKTLCKEIYEREKGTFRAVMKYKKCLRPYNKHYEKLRKSPRFYRESLKRKYRLEYDVLRQNPFILGRN